MKLDKGSFGKNQFWVLLGLAGVLLVATIGLLFFGPAANAGKARTQFDAELKSMDIKSPKNERFLTPWQGRQKEFLGQKVDLWKDAWKSQENLMPWPVAPSASKEVRDRWHRLAQKANFGDGISDLDRIDYRDTHYDTQFTRQTFLAPYGGIVNFPIDFD